MTTGEAVALASTASADGPGLRRGDRLQPLLLIGSIAVGLALAKIAPGFAESLSVGVSAGVFVLIYLVMLGVDARRVAAALTQRRFLAIAVVVNFVVNPLLAWGLSATFLQGHPDLQVGLILFLVTPCIGWYLVFTELAEGDTGLGVGLLGVNVVLQVLLLPVYLYAFTNHASTIDLDTVVKSIALYLVLPALAAELTRRVVTRSGRPFDEATSRFHLSVLKTTALAAVIVAMFASQANVLFDNPSVVLRLLAPLVAFFAIAFCVALAFGSVARLPHEQTALLAFTATSRNSEASLAIAATAFTSPLVGLTVVIGPVVELPLLVLMVRVLLARRPRPHPATTDSTSTSIDIDDNINTNDMTRIA